MLTIKPASESVPDGTPDFSATNALGKSQCAVLETDISGILAQPCTIAVVGLSPKPQRASFEVASYMQANGYRIIPVNPNAGVAQILGEKVYASLLEASQAEKIDVVNCFRNSIDIPPIVDDAIAIGAKTVWMQLGVSHAGAAAKAELAGLKVVQDRCLKIDHRTHQTAIKAAMKRD